MRYTVVVAERAAQDIVEIVEHVAAGSPQNALALEARLLERIDRLGWLPMAGALAPEGRILKRQIREAIVSPYRILYVVQEQRVGVLHVRHGARRPARDLDPFTAPWRSSPRSPRRPRPPSP